MLKAIKTENGWIMCGCCGKKLARVVDEKVNAFEVSAKEFVNGYPKFKASGFTIEFKCAGCKTLNIFDNKRSNSDNEHL